MTALSSTYQNWMTKSIEKSSGAGQKKEKHSPALGAQIYCQEIGIGDKDLLIQRTKIGAGAEIGAFQVVCPEGIPCAGAEDGFLWHIVHEYRDAQHSSQ